MLPNITFYSNDFYLGGGVGLFDKLAQCISYYEEEINFGKYPDIGEYFKDYATKELGFPSDIIKLSDTLYKILVYPPKEEEKYFYISTLSKEEILKQIKKDRLNSL